jgi:hypothetical protein
MWVFKRRDLLDKLRDYVLLKKDSAPSKKLSRWRITKDILNDNKTVITSVAYEIIGKKCAAISRDTEG